MASPTTNGYAIVTGAGRGIGKQLALTLAKKGYDVLAIDRVQSLLDTLPSDVTPLNADIGTPAGQRDVKAYVKDSPILILAHCAHCTGEISTLMNMDLETFRDIERSNIEAPIFLTQALLENIKSSSGKCRILIFGAPPSETFKPVPTGGSLFMTKCALKYMANVLRIEMKNVAKIGYVEPGMTKTEFIEGWSNGSGPFSQMLKGRIEKGHCYSAEETAEWLSAVLNLDDEAFEVAAHKEDNPEQSYGVKLTETPERTGAMYNIPTKA